MVSPLVSTMIKNGRFGEGCYLPQSSDPVTRAGGFLKAQGSLLQKLSLPTLFLFSSLHLHVYLRRIPQQQSSPGEESTGSLAPGVQLLSSLYLQRQQLGNSTWMNECKDRWATGLPVPSSVLFPLLNLSPRHPLQNPQFPDSC